MCPECEYTCAHKRGARAVWTSVPGIKKQNRHGMLPARICAAMLGPAGLYVWLIRSIPFFVGTASTRKDNALGYDLARTPSVRKKLPFGLSLEVLAVSLQTVRVQVHLMRAQGTRELRKFRRHPIQSVLACFFPRSKASPKGSKYFDSMCFGGHVAWTIRAVWSLGVIKLT